MAVWHTGCQAAMEGVQLHSAALRGAAHPPLLRRSLGLLSQALSALEEAARQAVACRGLGIAIDSVGLRPCIQRRGRACADFAAGRVRWLHRSEGTLGVARRTQLARVCPSLPSWQRPRPRLQQRNLRRRQRWSRGRAALAPAPCIVLLARVSFVYRAVSAAPLRHCAMAPR